MPHLEVHRGVHIGDCESWWLEPCVQSSFPPPLPPHSLPCSFCSGVTLLTVEQHAPWVRHIFIVSPVTGTFRLVARLYCSRMRKPCILRYGQKIWQRIKFGGLATRQARCQIIFRQIFVQISNWSPSTGHKISISQCR